MLYSQVAGQEETKKTLINSIKNNKVSHCYIFEGPKGIGKLNLAITFGQSIFCEIFNSEPCNQCRSCIKINTKNHPDFHIFNQDNDNIKREDVDLFLESINKKPYESHTKFYIFNDAEKMTQAAANALLKTLEEPSKDTVIILLTTNANLILPTIRSRSVILKFKKISKKTIKEYLINNYSSIKEMDADLASSYSQGILSKAINIINKEDATINKREEVIKLFDKIINNDKEIIYEVENYFDENKDNIDYIIELMMVWINDIILLSNNLENLMINKDLKKYALSHSKKMKKEEDIILYLQWVIEAIKSNANYKLSIDNMLLKIQEAFND